jgi:hypothetical protein
VILEIADVPGLEALAEPPALVTVMVTEMALPTSAVAKT